MELPSISLIKARLKFWRKILGLKRWSISIGYASIEEENIAYIVPLKRKKTAHITLNDIGKYNFIIASYYDNILLHELFHVIFANRRLEKKITDNQGFADLEEYICDVFAAALCRAHNLPIYDEPIK